MKSLLNWRQGVLYTLFVVAFFAAILIFGDDERPLGAWIEVRVYLFAIASGCFYALCRLARKWEREGKIKSPTIK